MRYSVRIHLLQWLAYKVIYCDSVPALLAMSPAVNIPELLNSLPLGWSGRDTHSQLTSLPPPPSPSLLLPPSLPRLYLQEELMSATPGLKPVISRITLALLEDSGYVDLQQIASCLHH